MSEEGKLPGTGDDGEGEDNELDEEQIKNKILILGNEIWKNFGQGYWFGD